MVFFHAKQQEITLQQTNIAMVYLEHFLNMVTFHSQPWSLPKAIENIYIYAYIYNQCSRIISQYITIKSYQVTMFVA